MNPECLFVLDHYNDYISGELSPEKASRVEEHVRICPNCESFLTRYQAVQGRAVGLLKIPAPSSLRESIHSLMEKV